jgi:hypothetical protein
MKPHQRFLLQAAISFLVPPTLFTGCSLIGLAIGAASDSSKKGGAEVSGFAELRKFETGTGIVLITSGGERIEGDFLAIRERTIKEYHDAYIAAIETLKVGKQLPLPGDTIRFGYSMAAGSMIRGKFLGVDPGLLLLWQRGGLYSLSAIRNLQSDSARPLDGFALHALTEEGRLPYCARGVMVKRDNDTVEVPVGEILRIERDAGGKGKLTGFLVGAVIDAVVIIVAVTQANQTERETTESCNRAWGPNNCHSNRVQG